MPQLKQAQAAALGIEPKFKYENLINQIVVAQGQFVAINPDDLSGLDAPTKQATLIQAARKRGLGITTTCRKPGMIYARLVVSL